MELLQLARFWSQLSPSPENSHSLEFCDNYPLGFLYTFIIQVCFPGHYTLDFLFIWLRCVLSFLIYILPPLALSFHDSVSAEDHRMFELCTPLSAHSLVFTDCMLIEYFDMFFSPLQFLHMDSSIQMSLYIHIWCLWQDCKWWCVF